MPQPSGHIEIVLNGAPHSVAADTSIANLLEQFDLNRSGVAVAVGGRVVPRSQHGQARLEDGQRVEVVQAVGGG